MPDPVLAKSHGFRLHGGARRRWSDSTKDVCPGLADGCTERRGVAAHAGFARKRPLSGFPLVG